MVLNDLNITIEHGKKIAIVGESGCGKSTTINLIERFYDVISGEILIDDINIKKYDINYLRDLIGYVQQEPVLFNCSIKDNIIFGRERKLVKLGDINEMVKEACDDAYIRQFIEKNNDKYEYKVGISGNNLSVGQKQRIAIARAILMKPKILILDEATSSLDNKSEKKVLKALDNVCKKNITTIVISHKLSTIKNSDLIYAMKEGKIIEKGTHKELLEMNGYYAGLIRDQIAADEIRQLNEKNISLNISMSFSYDCFDNENDIDDEDDAIKVDEPLINEEKNKIKIEKKKIWNFISDHKPDIVIGTIGGLIYGGLSPFVGLMLGNTVNSLSSIDPEKIKQEGFKYSMIFIGIAFLGGFSIFLKMWKLQCLGSIISLKIKKKIFEKYLELNMGFFDINSNSPGALSTKLAIDSSQIDSLILDLIGGTLTVISTLLISFIIGIIYDWKITIILFLFVPLIIYGIIKKDDYKDNGRESNKIMKIEAGSILSECVVNTKTIFSFNFQKKALQIFENILNTEKKYYLKNSMMQGFWIGLGLSAYNFAFGVVYKCGFIFLRNRTITFDNLMCCITNIINSCDGLSDILRNMGDSNKAKLAYKSIFDTLDIKSDLTPFQRYNNSKISANNLKGSIEFKNVFFSYPTKPNNLIFKDLSFKIDPGQNIGMVGLSGSGKSTIINLIERFYDVNSGEILIDGINIKEYNLYELRKKIGLVSQEPVIFKRNIYENILYGKLDSNEEDILEMAKNANIETFLIDKKYEKKDNNLLSGGEKQRVAIARAFIKDPKIILLDEVTSAMDKETESKLQKNIIELQKNRTCINISHRLNTIINSDIIFVIDSGQLVEKGTHKELLDLKGKYYTLWKYSKR
jgi:ABC-type multidrug transport system fused ATPase/permease subunit